MPTRNVVLTERQEEMIERLVQTGRYQNASEVLREGLRLLERRDAEDEAKLAALREAVAIGLEDLESGAFETFETSEALTAHLSNLARSALRPKRK